MTKFDTQELCGKLDPSRQYNMNTCSGLPVWPADPRPEDIRIEDIAGALSRICRYNGHLKEGVFFTRLVLTRLGLWAGNLTAGNKLDPIFMHLEIYSVAQHSVLVEQKVAQQHYSDFHGQTASRELLLAALLHDGPEYVLGDFVKPQKTMYSELPRYNKAWEEAVAARFDFDPALFDHPAIKEADYRIFLTEKRDLVNNKSTDFGVAKAEPYPERIVPVLPSAARKMFMDRFNELYKGE